MVHKLSIAVGIVAALQSVVAQEASAKPAPPKNPFRADNTQNLPFIAGQSAEDYHCTLWGSDTKWNNTWYMPCRLQGEYDNACKAVIPDGATQEEKAKLWKQQQKCLCVEKPDYFHVAANGCIGCKRPKGYNLESQKHVDAYKALFAELKGDAYCNLEGPLEGDYSSYYTKAFAKTGINYETAKMPTPREPFTVPVSEYWERPANYMGNPQNGTENATAQGTATLPPLIEYQIGVGQANSSKFAASNATVTNLVSIVRCLNLEVKFNNGQKKVTPTAEKVFTNSLSISTEICQEFKVTHNINIFLGMPIVQCSSSNCAEKKTQRTPKELGPSAANDGVAAPASVDTLNRFGGNGVEASSNTAMTVEGKTVSVEGGHAIVKGKKCRVKYV